MFSQYNIDQEAKLFRKWSWHTIAKCSYWNLQSLVKEYFLEFIFSLLPLISSVNVHWNAVVTTIFDWSDNSYKWLLLFQTFIPLSHESCFSLTSVLMFILNWQVDVQLHRAQSPNRPELMKQLAGKLTAPMRVILNHESVMPKMKRFIYPVRLTQCD